MRFDKGKYTRDEMAGGLNRSLDLLEAYMFAGPDNTCIECGEPHFVGHVPDCRVFAILHEFNGLGR